jgi:phage I-like protein
MTRKSPLTSDFAPAQIPSRLALCAALPIGDDDGVPEWVHLLPAGEVRTHDNRGPYRVACMATIAAGLKPGERLPIDECHSTDRAAPLGLPAPARGWIVELQARDSGLWGKVEWTEEGRRLMQDRAYRGISPAIVHSAGKAIQAVLRASLVNNPNLSGLTALHDDTVTEETSMDWKAKLIELLKLDGDADDAAIDAALSAKMKSGGVDLCSADVLSLPAVVALQARVTELTGALNGLTEAQARKDAEGWVDAAIAEGRVGLKPVRDEYVSLHMADAGQARKLIAAMPVLKHAVAMPSSILLIFVSSAAVVGLPWRPYA